MVKFDEYKKFDLSEDIGSVNLLNNKKRYMNILKKIWIWFWYSSANRNRIALTIRAGVPFLVLWGVADTEIVNQLIGEVGHVVALILEAIAGALTAWGILRKIWFTYR